MEIVNFLSGLAGVLLFIMGGIAGVATFRSMTMFGGLARFVCSFIVFLAVWKVREILTFIFS